MKRLLRILFLLLFGAACTTEQSDDVMQKVVLLHKNGDFSRAESLITVNLEHNKNLDQEMRHFLVKGGPVLIPFFAFSLGAGIELGSLVKAGLPGILLGILTTFIGGFFNILSDKATGGSGVAGAAASSTAGNAVATPHAMALADPSMSALASLATPLVAASTVTTAILTPLLTWMVQRMNWKK